MHQFTGTTVDELQTIAYGKFQGPVAANVPHQQMDPAKHLYAAWAVVEGRRFCPSFRSEQANGPDVSFHCEHKVEGRAWEAKTLDVLGTLDPKVVSLLFLALSEHVDLFETRFGLELFSGDMSAPDKYRKVRKEECPLYSVDSVAPVVDNYVL